jgi:lipoprotein NlpI
MDTTRPEHKVNVFISYSRKDIGFAEKLFNALAARGLSPKIDTQDLPSLEDWRRELLGAIGAADAVVFIVSKNSIASPVCAWEIEQVARLGKRLAPIVIERVTDDRIPAEIAKINYLFFDQEDMFEALVDTLADALQANLSWVKEHTRLGQQADRWIARDRPSALLLRGQELEDAERWISLQPRGAARPTDAHRLLIAQSRRGSTRRRNLLTGSLGLGLVIAVGLAGFAYIQRKQAIARSGEAQVQLSRALMAAGNPPAALSAAIDGARTINEAGASTAPAEAALYELFWSKPLPIATAHLNQASTGMPRIALASLSAESRGGTEGRLVDVFCVPAARRDDEAAIGPNEYCLQWSSEGLTSVPPSTGNTDAESFVTARTVDKKSYERREHAIVLGLNGKIYELAIDAPVSTAELDRVTTCGDRWIIAQELHENVGKANIVVTVVYDKLTNTQKTLTDAPLATNGQDPHCHTHSPYITLIGRGGPIVLVDGESGSSKIPDLRKFNTFRHGFEDPDMILSLSISKDIVLFSGAEVSRTAGQEKVVTQPIIYSLSTGRTLSTLEGHEHLIVSAVLAKSGKLAATITETGELRIWDVERALRIGVGRKYRESQYLKCKYDPSGALPDLDVLDSIDVDETCRVHGEDSARILAIRHTAQEIIVAQKAAGGSRLLAIDATGEIRREASLDVDIYDDRISQWTMSGGDMLAVPDKSKKLRLVSLESLGELLDIYTNPVRSVSRLVERGATDAVLIVDEQGVGELSIDRSGTRPSWKFQRRDSPFNLYKAAAFARFAGKLNAEDYDISLEPDGRLFYRHGAYVYCAAPNGDWAYRPICTIMDSITRDPVGDRLCLAGRLTEDHLFCLAQDRRSIEAYSFNRKKWITIASGDYVAPLERRRGGKILLDVEPFANCPNRIVLSYREYYNGGGGLRSPTRLVFDLDAQSEFLQLPPDVPVGTPGFCSTSELMSFAERSKDGLNPKIGEAPAPGGDLAKIKLSGTKTSVSPGASAMEEAWMSAYIETAQELLSKGREGEAEVQFAAALKRNPDAADRIEIARLNARGKFETENKRFDSAIVAFNRAIDLASREGVAPSVKAASLQGRGIAYDKKKHFLEAERDFREAQRLGFAGAGNWLWWATDRHSEQLRDEGKLFESLLIGWVNRLDLKSEVRKTIYMDQLRGNAGTSSYIIGMIYAREQSAGDEETECDRLASFSFDPYRRSPGVAFGSIDAPRAIEACEHVLAKNPKDGHYLYLRGRSHYRAAELARELGDTGGTEANESAAVADFRSAMAQGYPMAYNNMANAFEDGRGVSKNTSKAGELRVETLNRVLYCCWVTVARQLLANENKYDSDQVHHVVNELTRWSSALGNAEARGLLIQLKEKGIISPGGPLGPATFTDLPPWTLDASALIDRGLAHDRRREYDYAIANYDEAIRHDPNVAPAFRSRGFAYFQKGDSDRAIADFDQAIKLDASLALAYSNRGSAYLQKGNYTRAIMEFDRAIGLQPKVLWPHLSRGLSNLYNGSLPEALTDLGRAIELDPKEPYAALWHDIVKKRSNLETSVQETGQIDMTKWPAPVIHMFLGEATLDAVLSAADDPDENTKKNRLCEATFYGGELALQRAEKDEAARLFQLAMNGCPKGFIEWSAAAAELKALGVSP